MDGCKSGTPLRCIVQAMTAADIEEVLFIERASFRFPWSAQAFLSDLKLPYAIWRVARLYGEERPAPAATSRPAAPLPLRRNGRPPSRPVLGYAGLEVILDEGHIMNIAVHPDFRRQGIGELLLSDLIDQVRPLGVKRLTLEVRPSNLAAQALYRKYGFEVEGRRLRYYADGEDALIMWSPCLDDPQVRQQQEELRRRLLWRPEE